MMIVPGVSHALALPASFHDDAVIAAENDDVIFYKIPKWTESYNQIFGSDLANATSDDRDDTAKKKKDPVWMFDVWALDTYNNMSLGGAVGTTINHALIFCMDKSAVVRVVASAAGGPERWTLKTGYERLGADCYAGVIKEQTYYKPGRYIFTGTVQARTFKRTRFNTDTYKYWIIE